MNEQFLKPEILESKKEDMPHGYWTLISNTGASKKWDSWPSGKPTN